MEERRLEPRIEANAPITMTPLAAVATRIHGSVVNVSGRGLKVHVDAPPKERPAAGDVYRVQSGDDLMLCEVRHYQPVAEGVDLGFVILHWVNVGELSRLVKEFDR